MSQNSASLMDKKPVLVWPLTAIPRRAARVARSLTITFLVLLAGLHFIKPTLDPSWHFISEYAIGKNGWIMNLAFLLWAAAYIALFITIRSQVPRGIIGAIGLILLLVSATGLIIAGIFNMDPLLGTDTPTTAGKLHNLGGSLGMAMPFAAIFISWALSRNKDWSPAKRSILWSAGFAVFGFLLAFLSLGAMLAKSGGEFGPGVLVGWPNRFEVLTYCTWLIIVAGRAKYLKDQTNKSSTIESLYK